MRTTARLWLDNCSKNHEVCRRALLSNNKLYSVPTRLIDVGPEGQDTIRLIHTKDELADDLHTPYLILSYCWGKGNNPAKTTRDNLHQRKQKIVVSSLPKSVSDAIEVTRAMGIRYLWIDAICIVQPNNDGYYDDWSIEAAKMGSYYSSALCCISATWAKDSSDGFLGERYSARYPWWDDECILHDGSFFIMKPPYEITTPGLEFTPLWTRKWALQERVLSAQSLHWTSTGLIWECSDGLYRENEPLRNLRLQPDVFFGAQRDALASQVMNLPKEEALGFAWFVLLEQYSDMQLTVASDCLAAIHGIASRLSLQHDEEYFGGIFKSYCGHGLAWNNENLRNILVQGFPSWCWASVDSWDFQYLQYEKDHRSDFISLARWVESEQCPLTDTIPNFSNRSMRRIRVEAPLVTFRVEKPKLVDQIGFWSTAYWDSIGPIWQGQRILVTMDRRASVSAIPAALDFFVCLEVKHNEVTYSYYGIIVERSEMDGEGAYIRVGSFRSASKEGNDCLGKWITEIDIY